MSADGIGMPPEPQPQPHVRLGDSVGASIAQFADQGSDSPRVEAVETLLRQAIRIVEQARIMPLSTSVMINRDECWACCSGPCPHCRKNSRPLGGC